MSLLTFNVIKILLLTTIAATLSIFFAAFLTKYLYKIHFWKKEARTKTITGDEATVFNSLHKDREVSVPRGGGLLIFITAFIIIAFFFLLANFTDIWWLKKLNFLSRSETWLPLFALVAASIFGLIDDISVVFGKGKYVGGGLTFKKRLLVVALIGLVCGLWFYYKLGWDAIHIPLLLNFPEGFNLTIGFWMIPLFIFVMIASWAGGVVDGIDGLAGGVFASIFGAFTIIAFAQGKTDLAAFCAIILGTLFAFLWFNIPPAKFYMGEVGTLGLTTTMAVVAFLTDSVVVLPIIAGILLIEVGSMTIQLLSKRFRHKKIWLCTPIHHHFEAKGWPPYQVTMRFWIIGIILAVAGVAIRLLG